MDLSKIQISNIEKNNHLCRIKLLNEYLEKVDSLSKVEIEYIKNNFLELLGIIPAKIEIIKSFNLPFERMVVNKNNKRLTNLSQLRYPPKDIAKDLNYNRASLKGQSVFYAGSSNLLPIVVETQPQKGQLTTTSKWVLKKGYCLNLLVICQDEKLAMSNHELWESYKEYNYNLNQLYPNTKEIVVAINSLIIKAFTRKVNPENKQGYLFSALFADHFFNHFDNPIDAIYYPSVPNDYAAMNIAVKPEIVDLKFEMIEAKEAVILKNPEPNKPGWHTYTTGICIDYNNSNLELKWVNQIIPANHCVNSIINEYNIDMS